MRVLCYYSLAKQLEKYSVSSIYRALVVMILASICQGCEVKSQQVEGEEPVVRANQIGYLTSGKKQAVVVNPEEERFSIIDSLGKPVYEGNLLETKFWDKSGENVAVADFTGYKIPGIYKVKFGNTVSHPFLISENPYVGLLKGSAKAFYYNRASTALEEPYAGTFARKEGHPDTSVVIHASAASSSRPAGSVISTPYGWYDAGDYNKYVVNSGISTYTLMLAYEHNKELFSNITWNIPESGNQLPDLLDEIYWNLKWLITMQDPADGGVYNKTTTASFESFVAPKEANSTRYVVAKGTAAALNFAAVMAKAAVIYQDYYPGDSDKFIKCARDAWDWSVLNPSMPYKNPAGADGYPTISTGGYGDSRFEDEFFWAATELYLATGESQFREKIDLESIHAFRVPTWNSVETLGLLSLVDTDQEVDEMLRKKSIDQLLIISEKLLSTWRGSPYRITMDQFEWGSNSTILNQCMVLINAYRVFGKSEFYEAAISNLDYVLGKNATGYCFVTGFGAKYPMNIHHRPSASDDIEEPVPGFLAGGPNPGNVGQDCNRDKYPSLLPAKCYLDDVCSYSTNEITINWNAPLVYVVGSIQSSDNQ